MEIDQSYNKFAPTFFNELYSFYARLVPAVFLLREDNHWVQIDQEMNVFTVS